MNKKGCRLVFVLQMQEYEILNNERWIFGKAEGWHLKTYLFTIALVIYKVENVERSKCPEIGKY